MSIHNLLSTILSRGGVILLALAWGGGKASAQRTLAPGHVPAAVKNLTAFADVPATNILRLAIGLPLRNRTELDALVQSVSDPSSGSYRHYLTPQQMAAQFSPTVDQYEAVKAFARSNHLTVVHQHDNRMLLDVSGAAADIDQAFNIHLRQYHRPNGKGDFFAPDVEPQVPDQLPILDVSGLNNYNPPHPLLHLAPAAVQPRGGSASSGSYIGNDFRAAYVPGVSLTGTGQTLGLLEFDGFYASDIASYAAQAGVAEPPVQTILVDGYNGTPTTGTASGNPEVSLDIEMAIALAPGLSNILVYETGPGGVPNDLLNEMLTNNPANQLSCSWGWGGGPSATTDQIFLEMDAQGQSFFCASGDSDAYSSGEIDQSSAANAPSDNPYITIVGATELSTTGPSGSWVSETVWNWDDNTGSSGGISSYYAIPSWQSGVNFSTSGGSSTMRNIPDVALTGDNVYVVYGNGSAGVFGGTSCAAPLWAAFTALVNQQGTNEDLSSVGFVNPALYALALTTNYLTVFHDVVVGNNTNSTSPFLFYARAGYDLCTGLGTPTGAALINALTAPPDVLGINPSTGFAASGLVGGPFSATSAVFTLTNAGSNSLVFSAGTSASWLSVSPDSGTISPQSSASVTVSLTAAAYSFSSSSNTATVYFTNNNSGYVYTRTFSLIVTTQLVVNGGFETGSFSGWTVSGNNGNFSVTTASSYVHSGTFGAALGPTGSLGYLAQNLTTVPGQVYLLSFWLDRPSTRGSGTTQFQAAWNGTNLVNLTNTTITTWTNFQFLVAASFTNTALQFGFREDPKLFGFDDVSVTAVATPVFQIITQTNTTVQLTFTTSPGQIYRVQYTTNLPTSGWMNLGQTFTAASTNTLYVDATATNVQRFYRLLVVP